mgnify:CR=1 FL=1
MSLLRSVVVQCISETKLFCCLRFEVNNVIINIWASRSQFSRSCTVRLQRVWNFDSQSLVQHTHVELACYSPCSAASTGCASGFRRHWRLGGGLGGVDTGEHKDGGLPPHSPKRHHRTADNLKKLFHSVPLSATFPSGVLFKNRFVLTRAPTCEAAATSLRGRCKQNSPLNNHSYMTWSPTLPAAQISRSAQSMQHSFMSVGDTSR